MRTVISLLFLTLATVTPRAAHATVNVVTTIQVFGSLAQEVGGDKVSVTALVGDGVDPHHVDPRPSYAVTLNKADLLVDVGLDLETGWLPPLVDSARNPKIQPGAGGRLDASSAGITVLDVGGPTSRAHGDIHPNGNPHYWLAPDNVLRVARAIADRLKTLDAKNAPYYDGRYTSFALRIAGKRREWDERAKSLRGVKVVTYHKSWSYLTSWLGLVEIGYVEPKPGIPPSPSHLAGLVKTARSQGARLEIVESFYPRNTAQKVAEASGMRLVVLPSDGRDYVKLVDDILGKLLGR